MCVCVCVYLCVCVFCGTLECGMIFELVCDDVAL